MNKSNKPLLTVLHGGVPEHTPVWLMRQAGRYLPEYRELRTQANNFLKLCLTPDLATEITLQPIRRFGMDAAILFADILLVPLALGQKLDFLEGEGPHLDKINDEEDLDRLSYQAERVAPVFETVRRVKSSLPAKTALIGFCGAPWTVAAYMIDGNSKDNFALTKIWVKEKPELLDRLLQKLIETSEEYLAAQIEAGAEVLQIFDSWAGLLADDPKAFDRLIIRPTRDLVTRLKKKYPEIPIIGFPREGGQGYEPYIRQTGIDALSIDPTVDLIKAKNDLQSIKPLQGNLAPELLVKGGEDMRQGLKNIMTTFGPRHIVNLGHGVVPQTPPEHVAELVNFVHGFKI